MTNEAAERLLIAMAAMPLDCEAADLMELAREALADERRATVERIKVALLARYHVPGHPSVLRSAPPTWERLAAILDAEADR